MNTRKKFSCTKDGLRQLELDQFFLIKKVESVPKVEKEVKNNKKILSVDDVKSVVKRKENKYTTMESSLHSERFEINLADCTSKSKGVHPAMDKRKSVFSLNKCLKQTESTEKVKPRILQNIFDSPDIPFTSSMCSNNKKSLSQNSTSSDDTIIYDPYEGNSFESINEDRTLSIYRLIQKVDNNVQATKSSSVAFKKFPTQKEVSEVEESELINPRAVNFVTKIVKYVFTQPHFKILFNEEEVKTLENFFSLTLPEYNYFCYKLYTRLPRWYNIFSCAKISICV